MASHRHAKLSNWWTGWILLATLCATAIAQDRRWSVRKTGEFGRKIVENIPSASSAVPSRAFISKELQLPSRLSVAESRRTPHTDNSQFFRGAGANPSGLEIRKPSLNLELPRFATHQNFVVDQEAQETEDQEGYVYQKPDSSDNFEGYVYTTPSPAAKPNEEPEEDPATQPPELPAPGVPIVVNQAFNLENQEDIDSQGNRLPPNQLSPQVVGVPTDDHKPACSESHDGSDPACWPHGYEGVIPGRAGEDYPILSEIIQTQFSCDDQPFSGYYADTDPEARCQIFHICLKRNRYRKTNQWSFLCPNGTIFSQPDFVCVWWGDAPQCSDTVVRSLYNLNEQLGWDNITEGGGAKQGRASGGELQGSMSAFNAKLTSANRQSSAIPYRVPVKVPDASSGRSRTRLQEVTQNALHGQGKDLDYGEHDGEESSNFETSLRKQSESRSKTKSGSALHKSVSEGYELKGSADGVQPFIVNREPPLAPTVQPQSENDVVMMPTIQRFPDGSEGFGEVAVMLPHHTTNPPPTERPLRGKLQRENDINEGYQYPNPTSTPAPTYLPPRRTTTPPPTTTEYFPPPTIPTEPPIPPQEYDNYEQYNPDRVTTTEQPEDGYRYPQPTTTEYPEEQEQGYNYPNQQQSQQQQAASQDNNDGYQYPQPTTTERQFSVSQQQQQQQDVDEDGYRYPNPTTTQRSSRFRQTNPTTTEVVTEATTTELPAAEVEEEDGYNYQPPTGGSQFESLRETTENNAGYNYPRPSTTTENYNNELSTQQSAGIVREETTTTSAPPTTSEDVELPAGGYLPPRSSNQLSQQQQQGDENSAAEEVDYEEDDLANEVVTGSTASASVSNDEDESGYSYNVPTPASSGNEIVLNGGALDSDDKLNEILKQVQSGNIEAVDSSGKPIEFSKLKDLLLNSPRGSVDLKGEVDSVTSSSTEVTTTPYSNGPRIAQPPQQAQPSSPAQSQPPHQQYYHTVTTASIVPNNPQNNQIFNTNNNAQTIISTSGGSTSPSGLYLPPNNGFSSQPAPAQQQQYYNGNQKEIRVQYVDHPSYEINLPSREFETHTQVDLNTIAVDANNNQLSNRPFSQQQPQSGYFQQQPQQPFIQQQQQQRQPPIGDFLPPPQQQIQQPRPDYDRSNALNNVVLPVSQQQQNLQQRQPSGEYLPPRQATSSILQPQYYQQSQSSPTGSLVSQPIQLTENIQLQQSFALPTQEPLLPSNNRNNPLLDPKNIKIVPALFVHQHTSVASDENNVRGETGRNIEEAFQTLDTAQSSYYTTSSSSLSQQLNQLANLSPQSNSHSSNQRQFFRRSNAKNNGGGQSSASSSGGSSHTIEKAHQVSTFTLEDARTPDEIQKYHHEDLKRFYKDNIAQHPGVLDDVEASPPPVPTRRTLPVVSSIAKESSQPQQFSSRGGKSTTTGSSRFSVGTESAPSPSTRQSSSRDIPSSHRNEEYFIPVSGSYGGGSEPSRNSGRSSSSGGGVNIVRNSNSASSSNSNSNIYSQFRVNGGGGSSRSRSSENRGGSGDRGSTAYQFVNAEERTLLSRFLPEEEGGFGSRLFS